MRRAWAWATVIIFAVIALLMARRISSGLKSHRSREYGRLLQEASFCNHGAAAVVAYDAAQAAYAPILHDRGGQCRAKRVQEQAIEAQLAGATNVKVLRGGSTHLCDTVGFAALLGGVPVVAFAGTQNYDNVLTGLNAFHSPLSYFSGFEAADPAATVHSGVAMAWMAVAPEVLAWVRGLKTSKPILLTGHSLGSGLAQLGALHLQLAGHPAGAVTFAPINVGNERWVLEFNRHVDTSLHFLAEGDPIAQTPGSLFRSSFHPVKGYTAMPGCRRHT